LLDPIGADTGDPGTAGCGVQRAVRTARSWVIEGGRPSPMGSRRLGRSAANSRRPIAKG